METFPSFFTEFASRLHHLNEVFLSPLYLYPKSANDSSLVILNLRRTGIVAEETDE